VLIEAHFALQRVTRLAFFSASLPTAGALFEHEHPTIVVTRVVMVPTPLDPEAPATSAVNAPVTVPTPAGIVMLAAFE
jgi:hypothetical protein